MAIDQDTLNVLNRIEKILAGSNRMTGGRDSPAIGGGSSARTAAADARAEEASQQQTRKIVVSTGKAVARLGYVANNASEQLVNFTRKTGMAGTGLGDFTGVIAKSISQISAQRAELGKIDMSTTMSALQSAVADAASSIKASNLAKGDTTGFAKTISTLDDLIDNKVNPRLGSFNSALHLASKSLIDLWGDMREQRRDGGKEIAEFGKGVQVAANALSRNRGVGEYFEKFILQLRRANVALRELRTGARSGGGGGGGGSNRAADSNDGRRDAIPSEAAKGLPAQLLSGVWKRFELAGGLAAGRMVSSFIKIVDEAFQTTGARGFGTIGKNFFSMSLDAALAGQSLEEFVKMLEKNEGTVSRFSSFAAFDNQLDVGRDALKKFGIFGQEATNLSAAMVNSAQSLGVPVQDLSKSIGGQMSVFETLRKTTGITAEQFEELNRTLQSSEVVQRELIGLAPEDRAARYKQLTETAAWGRQLGLTTQAATELQNALLAQRKTTVKERFNARGRLTQSLSLVGMDPSTIAEAAALAGKRMKTPEEEKRLTEILGDYNARAEEIKQNGGEGMANAVETSQENLAGTTLKPLLDASVSVKAAQDSGAQINKEMNQQLGNIAQILGKTFSILEGLGKSSIFQFALGAFAAAMLYNNATLPTRIAAALRGIGGLPGVGGAGGKVGTAVSASSDLANATMSLGADGSGGEAGKKAGRFGRVGAALGKAGSFLGSAKGLGIVGSVAGAGLAAYQYSNADEAAKVENGGDGDVGRKKGEAIGEGIGLAAGTIAGAFLGPIGAMIIGPLGSWAGKLIGGFIGSENATEKNNREVNKLSKEMIATRRATAGSDTITTTNLASLSSNVLQTGKAFADNTAEQVQKAQDEVNKKNGTTQNAGSVEMEEVPIFDPMSGVQIGTGLQPKSSSSKVTGLATTAQPIATPVSTAITAQSIATPVSTTPTSVNQEAVNTAATTAAASVAERTTAAVAATSTLQPTDQASTLAEILKILQQSLSAENTQVDLVSQLLRSPAFANRLTDTNVLMDRAIRTA